VEQCVKENMTKGEHLGENGCRDFVITTHQPPHKAQSNSSTFFSLSKIASPPTFSFFPKELGHSSDSFSLIIEEEKGGGTETA
jgi:hypothetical protein